MSDYIEDYTIELDTELFSADFDEVYTIEEETSNIETDIRFE